MFDLRLDLERPCCVRVKNYNTSIVEYGNCEIILADVAGRNNYGTVNLRIRRRFTCMRDIHPVLSS